MSAVAQPAYQPARYPQASRALSAFDKRTRQIADIGWRLHCELAGSGEITGSLLLAEGVSYYEQKVHWPAARQLMRERQSRQLRDETADRGKTDEELLAEGYSAAGGAFREGDVVAALRGKLLWSHDRIARLWPKLMVKLAQDVACTPIPAAR